MKISIEQITEKIHFVGQSKCYPKVDGKYLKLANGIYTFVDSIDFGLWYSTMTQAKETILDFIRKELDKGYSVIEITITNEVIEPIEKPVEQPVESQLTSKPVTPNPNPEVKPTGV